MKPSKKLAADATLLQGDVLNMLPHLPEQTYDLIISSPPYNIGKIYERNTRLSLSEYIGWQDEVIGQLVNRLAKTGSICWQVGNYIKDGETFPLDLYFYESFKKRGLKLRNRIIWTFNFGLHSTKRLSGRYETILWFTKSDNYKFNLDSIRVSQIYPGKRHPATRNNGHPSGNPLGKNPGDVWHFSADEHFKGKPIWEIPNVKANHVEKTDHPCQFPVELVERCVLALTAKGDSVLDPFVGTGTSVIAAVKHGRRGMGIDKDASFIKIAQKRLEDYRAGTLRVRPIGRAIYSPKGTEKVAIRPQEWITA